MIVFVFVTWLIGIETQRLTENMSRSRTVPGDGTKICLVHIFLYKQHGRKVNGSRVKAGFHRIEMPKDLK